MSLEERQKDWIRKLAKLIPENSDSVKDLKLARDLTPEGAKEYWSYSNTTDYWKLVDHHSILDNMLVIEYDSSNRKENYENCRKVAKFLRRRGIPFIIADHYGRSPHIYVFFSIDEEIFKEENIDYKTLRIILWRWVHKKVKIDAELPPEVTFSPLYYDEKEAYPQNLRGGHLIRAIGGRYFRNGEVTYHTTVSRVMAKKVTEPEKVEFPEKIGLWHISKEEFSRIMQEIYPESKEEKIEILLDGFSKLRIHPALEFSKDKCYLGIFLPVKKNDLERDILCILTDEREIFPATIKELDKRLLSLKYKPVYFQRRISLECIKAFLAGEGVVPNSVFGEIKEELKKYIEFSSKKAYDFFTIWIIGTYLHPLFGTYPYIYLSGLKECGKTKTLMLVNCLAFNSIFSGNISTPSIYRLIQNARCTLLIDETEKLANPERAQEFRAILLSGYKQGIKVYRTEKNTRLRFEVQEFEAYSPKIIANIHGLDDVLESRCIKFVMRRTMNRDIGNREVNISDERWQEFRDKLYLLMLNHWKEMAEIYQSLANEGELPNREWELWRPILAIAKFLSDELYREMLSLAKEKSKERKTENVTETGECILVESLLDLVNEPRYYKLKEIKEKMVEKFDEEQRWLSNRWISRALARLGFSEKRRLGTGVEYRLEPKAVVDLALRLGLKHEVGEEVNLEMNIKPKLDEESVVGEGLNNNLNLNSEREGIKILYMSPDVRKEKYRAIREILSSLGKESGLISLKSVREEALRRNIDGIELEEIIENLKNRGEIYEPVFGFLALTELGTTS